MIKVFKNTDSIIVKKTAIYDNRLSFSAKGVYVYLLTDPNELEIENYYRENEEFKKGLDELIKIGAAQISNNGSSVFDYYQQKIGMNLKTFERDGLIEYIKNTNDLLLKEAINRTASVPKKNAYNYMSKILIDWKSKNINDMNSLIYYENEKKLNTEKERLKNNGSITKINVEDSNFKGIDLTKQW